MVRMMTIRACTVLPDIPKHHVVRFLMVITMMMMRMMMPMMMTIVIMLLNDDRCFCVYCAHDRHPPVHVSFVRSAFGATQATRNTPR